MLGYTEAEILGKVADVIFAPEDREAGVPEVEAQTALTQGRALDIEHLVTSAEQMIRNFNGLEKEMEREV
jgi:hypothetical protein